MGCGASNTAAAAGTTTEKKVQPEEKKGKDAVVVTVSEEPGEHHVGVAPQPTPLGSGFHFEHRKGSTFEDDLKWAKSYLTADEQQKLHNTFNIINEDGSGSITPLQARRYYKSRIGSFKPSQSVLFAASEFVRKADRYELRTCCDRSRCWRVGFFFFTVSACPWFLRRRRTHNGKCSFDEFLVFEALMKKARDEDKDAIRTLLQHPLTPADRKEANDAWSRSVFSLKCHSRVL
jgi:hypothetical protein